MQATATTISTATDRAVSLARVENLGEPVFPARDEAIATGYRFYSTGIPCKYGHIAERRVSDHSCMGCRRMNGLKKVRHTSHATNAGKLPYLTVLHSGLLTPAGENDITAFYVRDGADRHGRIIAGVYRRDCGSQVASFLPGLPRAVDTFKDLFAAAFANRKCFDRMLSEAQLRELYAGRNLFPQGSDAAADIEMEAA